MRLTKVLGKKAFCPVVLGRLSQFLHDRGLEGCRAHVLAQALTSYNIPHVDTYNTKAFAYLGDGILELGARVFVIDKYKLHSAADMHLKRVGFINNVVLGRVFEEHLGLGDLGASTANEVSPGTACEALVGAIYTEMGLDAALDFSREHIFKTCVKYSRCLPLHDLGLLVQSVGQSMVFNNIGNKGDRHHVSYELCINGKSVLAATGKSTRAVKDTIAEHIMSKEEPLAYLTELSSSTGPIPILGGAPGVPTKAKWSRKPSI